MGNEAQEVWKDIDGFVGLYQVSNLGRIKALKKKTKTHNGTKTWPERIVKPIVLHSGYADVGLWRNGTCKRSRVHRLVAYAFCPNDATLFKDQVNHKNENKLDNRAENLEWVTPKENTNFGTCIARRIYGRIAPVDCLDRLTGDVLKTFKSQADANAWCGVARNDGHISQCCKGMQKTAYGYRWQYHKGGAHEVE